MNKLYRELFEQIDLGLAVLELDGKIRAANAEFCRIAERPESEVVGHVLEEIMPLRAEPKWTAMLSDAQEEQQYRSKQRISQRDGSTLYLSIGITLVQDDASKPRWILTVRGVGYLLSQPEEAPARA